MNLLAEFASWGFGRVLDIFKPPNRNLGPVIPILPEAIARAAEAKIGVREKGGNNKGEDLAPFFAADAYDPNGAQPGDDGYAWCAAFCCYCVKAAIEAIYMTPRPGFTRPTTPGAWAFEEWSLAQDATTHTKKKPRGDIRRGDLVVYKFSHIGVAVGPVSPSGYFETVEGNTNKAGSREGDGVYPKRRHIDEVRSRIRFTV